MDIIKPMLAKLADLPQNDQDYAFEIKWDGMRAILYSKTGQIRILSRNQNDVTSQYPELLGIAKENREFILDGEIVFFDNNGKPSFSGLQRRMGLHQSNLIKLEMERFPVSYIIFDLLSLEGNLLLNQSYIDRQRILANLNLTGSAWKTPGYQLGSGQDIMQGIRELNLEGLIAKRLLSPYTPDKRGRDWLKIKNKKSQEFIICGWIPGKGNRENQIGALLLGYYNKTALAFAGRVGTGFNTVILKELKSLLEPLTTNVNPFCTDIQATDAIFVRPFFVCEVEFTEWTALNTLRHPSFKGLRIDKSADEVVKESL